MLLFSLQLSAGTFATSVCVLFSSIIHVKLTGYLVKTGFQILSSFQFFELTGLSMVSK